MIEFLSVVATYIKSCINRTTQYCVCPRDFKEAKALCRHHLGLTTAEVNRHGPRGNNDEGPEYMSRLARFAEVLARCLTDQKSILR